MTEDSLWGPRYRSVMTALMATMAIASYNNLAVTAALPDVGDDLGSIELLPWVITVQLFTASVAVLAAGPLVDSFGIRRTFRYVGIGFIITSVVISGAPTMGSLIAARAVQGVFAGAVMTVSIAGIGVAIPARLRPRAFALISAVWGVMGVAGPAIAATVLAFVGWRGIFLVNVPVTALALALGWNRLPDRQEGAARERVDAVGLVLVAVITAGALSITTARPTVMVVGALVMVVAAAFYRGWAAKTPDPVVKLRHLANSRYRTVHLTTMAVMAGGVGADSFLPLYIRGARGGSTTLAAFSVLFLTVGWTASSVVSSKLQDQYAGERVTLLGAFIAVPGAVLVALSVYFNASLALIFAAFVWLGAGVGMISSTGSAVLQNRAEVSEMGRINGAHHFLRSIAIALGIATIAAITLGVVNSRVGDVEAMRDLLSDDETAVSDDLVDALSDGYAYALMAGAAVVAVTIPSALHLVRTEEESQELSRR
ncbi:MAG: MFS transporter [Acidimicrobiales bacterium]